MKKLEKTHLCTKEFFISSRKWGMMVSLDVLGCRPYSIRYAWHIKDYVTKLCNLIDMKKYGETHIENFGKEERVYGYSMFQFIETSSIQGHFSNENNNAYIDIFSCKWFDPNIVENFTKDFFNAKEIKVNIILRD